MALLSPTLEIINRQKVQPTPGERKLLEFLLETLDDSYEIYFQPFLNGDNPDFAIMRKGSGLLLIEVKDWNLEHYYLDKNTKWRLKKNDAILKSPLNQVESYKENLFHLHIEELFRKNISNKNHWATVNCAVYFHNATRHDLSEFLLKDFLNSNRGLNYSGYNKFISYFGLLGYDSLNENFITELFNKFWLSRKSKYFDDILYDSFKRYLKPPFHQIEDGIEITYSKEQEALIPSEKSQRRKIKGIAGCGKTLLLAKKAVNAHIRTGGQVLILTYNLSLKNYIHDRINDVREDFNWNNFIIINYHQFFKSQANNNNLEIHDFSDWDDINYFESAKNQTTRFDAVFIDEVQDYKQEWIDIISKYFMNEDTEWIVFGDEKQNIYERELSDENEIVIRKITGPWNKSLNNVNSRKPSFRMSNSIYTIILRFQILFFQSKYNLEFDAEYIARFKKSEQLAIDFNQRIIEYHYFNSFNTLELFEEFYKILEKNSIHSSNAGVLCSRIDILRSLDFLIRTKKNERTATTFESQEEYNIVESEEMQKLLDSGIHESDLKLYIKKEMHNKLEEIRKLKKNHFWMNTGTVKLSTVHSFKGWEIDTLFLFIANEEDEFTNSELIYTGLTRAKNNLIVFNLGNIQYDEFFKTEIESSFIHN